VTLRVNAALSGSRLQYQNKRTARIISRKGIYGILLGGGFEVGLPTDKDRKGIGHDNIFELEPFVDFGYKNRDLEVVGFLSLSFPVNQKNDQD